MALKEALAGLGEDVKKIPPWGWAVLAIAGFFVVRGFLQSRSGGVTPAGSTAGGSAASSGYVNQGVQDLTGSTTGTAGSGTSGNGTTTTGSGTGTTSGTGSQAPTTPPPSSSSAAPASPGPSGPSGTPYTVKPGDTLSSIGAAFGEDWHAIYSNNAGLIESTAKAHGFGSSDGGHWIFPGEVLYV